MRVSAEYLAELRAALQGPEDESVWQDCLKAAGANDALAGAFLHWLEHDILKPKAMTLRSFAVYAMFMKRLAQDRRQGDAPARHSA